MADGDSSADQKPKVDLPIPHDRLESIINKALGTNSKLETTRCEIIGEGKGFLSIITKAELTWSASDGDKKALPETVILKKPSSERMKGVPVMEKVFGDPDQLRQLHNRECDAYQFFNRYKPAPFPMARCFIAEKMCDKDPSKGLLILEHMGANCRSLHFNQDATLEKVLTVVDHLASLQAYGFEHPDYQETIGEMPTDMFEMLFDGVEEAANELREKHPDKFDLSEERVAQLLAECREDVDIFKNPRKHGYTGVLCLGDTQPNNLLWKVMEDDTLSDEVGAFLDFQLAHTGICCYDLGMLSVMNVSLDVWQKNEEKIFKHYLNALKSKTTKDVTITMDEIKRGYALQKKVWGLGSVAMVKALDVVGEKAGITPEKIDEMLDRMLDGIKELKQ